MKEIIIEKELLESLKLGNQYTVDEICVIFNCSKSVIERKLSKYNIPPFWPDEYNISDNELKELYFQDKLTIQQIANKLGCSKTCIRYKFKRIGITAKNRSERQLGRCKSLEHRRNLSKSKLMKYKSGKTISWNKGIGRGKYNYEFRYMKPIIYKIYGKMCNYCGSTEKLCIHHIDYNKNNNSVNNLIPLCVHCHAKTNGKRQIWYNIFSLNLHQKPKNYLEYIDSHSNMEELIC